MKESKDNIFLVVIVTIVALISITLIVWVHNATDSLVFNITGENNTNISNSTHICTAEEKQAEICTMEYAPVCGTKENCGDKEWCKAHNVSCGACSIDVQTYSTGCVACSSGVDFWIQGECIQYK